MGGEWLLQVRGGMMVSGDGGDNSGDGGDNSGDGGR